MKDMAFLFFFALELSRYIFRAYIPHFRLDIQLGLVRATILWLDLEAARLMQLPAVGILRASNQAKPQKFNQETSLASSLNIHPSITYVNFNCRYGQHHKINAYLLRSVRDYLLDIG